VDLSSLGSMGELERLDDPIDTTTENRDNRHKEEHKARGTHLRMGCINPRDVTVNGCMGLFGCTSSMKGRDHSFVHDGL
jgi:hypothetical protein